MLVPIGQATTRTSTTSLRVVVFPGGQAWPLWAAQDRGFFRDAHLAVETSYTPGSVFMMTNLLNGQFDIALTNVDNVVAYDEGQGEVLVSASADLFAFMGGNNGFLTLYVQPDITRYADLKGKTLAVDAVTTGYAFVLREMLSAKGLAQSDYRLEPVGGTALRWTALQQGRYAGALLNPHFDALATAQGFRLLGRATETLPHYQAIVGTASRRWALGHEDTLVRFIRAYRASVTWLCNPSNRAAALAIFRRHMPDVSQHIASATYEEEFVNAGGFQPSLALDVEGIRTVLVLRSQYGLPKKTLTDPAKYYDLTYYNRANAPR